MTESVSDALSRDASLAAAMILRERAQRLAQPLAAAVDVREGLEVLSFMLGRERYAIETRFVHGTRRASTLTPLPMAGKYVLGITNVHGELLVVFNLRALLGANAGGGGYQDGKHFVLLGDEQAELAVEVDSLDTVEKIDPEKLHNPPGTLVAGARANLLGVTQLALLVLDGTVLLADDRLYVDAP